MEHPKVAIPIEIKKREINGKLLLAYELAKRGFTVFTGKDTTLEMGLDKLRPDFFLGQNMDGKPYNFKLYKSLKAAGAKVLVLENEGSNYRPPEAHLKRVNQQLLDVVDKMFVWGQSEKEVIENNRRVAPGKLVVSGSPIYDMARLPYQRFFHDEANTYREAYGNFVLFNTNFPRYNKFERDRPIDFREGEYEFIKNMYYEFMDAIPALAKQFPNLNFVVRPHPAENIQTYEEAFESLKNVHVRTDGTVYAWIIACALLIHNGCYTAVESFLMDKITLSYRPFTDERNDAYLPNNLSHEVFDLAGVEAKLEGISMGQAAADLLAVEDADKRRGYLGQFLHNAEHLAVEVIADTFAGMEAGQASGIKIDRVFKLKRRLGSTRLLHFAMPKTVRVKQQFNRMKFPGLTIEEVRGYMDFFAKINGDEGQYQVKPITFAKDNYTITRL